MNEADPEPHLVAFVDILGTKGKVASGTFSDMHLFDFANIIGVAAHHNPDSRFAAFSDSAIISTPASRPNEFLGILDLCFSNWFADAIFVRGGVAVGGITWVDIHLDQVFFRQLPNFACARVYGPALVEAVELERTSGPGAFAFASDAAAELLATARADSIYRDQSNVVVCLSPERLNGIRKLQQRFLDIEDTSGQRHLRASIRLIDRILHPTGNG